jgi:hypothetical protein
MYARLATGAGFMTEQEQSLNAYIYRYRKLSEQEFRLLLEHIFVTQTCFCYASNYRTLRPIEQIEHIADLPLQEADGLAFEQGQIFNEAAEVRWKYNGEHYDILLLTEEPKLGEDLFSRKSLGHYRYLPKKDSKQLLTPEEPDRKAKKLLVREYYAENLAVIWSRYLSVEEGKSNE